MREFAVPSPSHGKVVMIGRLAIRSPSGGVDRRLSTNMPGGKEPCGLGPPFCGQGFVGHQCGRKHPVGFSRYARALRGAGRYLRESVPVGK